MVFADTISYPLEKSCILARKRHILGRKVIACGENGIVLKTCVTESNTPSFRVCAPQAPVLLLFAPASTLPSQFRHNKHPAFRILDQKASSLLPLHPARLLPSGFRHRKELSLLGFWPASPLPLGFHTTKTPSFSLSHQQATTSSPGLHLPSAFWTSKVPFLPRSLCRQAHPYPPTPPVPFSPLNIILSPTEQHLRSAIAEGRGVAFCPTGLQNDAIFCPKYNVPTFLPKIWLFLAKIQLFSRGLEIVSANATSSPESETFSPREYHHLSPRNRTFSPLKCHFSLQIRTFSPKCNFSLPAVTKPPQNTPFLQKCSAFSPKYHFLPQR